MKPFITLIMLLPVILIGQDLALVTDFTPNELVLNEEFSMYTDVLVGPEYNTSPEEPESSAVMDMDLSDIVIEFSSTTGISGPAQGSGISNGLNILAAQEGMSAAVSVGIGPGNSISSAGPALIEFSFTRDSDENTTLIRSHLINETVIPYIEVFYLKQYSTYKRVHVIRYENCIISDIQMSNSEGAGGIPNETVSFGFSKACYRSYKNDTNGNELSQNNTCFDQTVVDQGSCSCSPF